MSGAATARTPGMQLQQPLTRFSHLKTHLYNRVVTRPKRSYGFSSVGENLCRRAQKRFGVTGLGALAVTCTTFPQESLPARDSY